MFLPVWIYGFIVGFIYQQKLSHAYVFCPNDELKWPSKNSCTDGPNDPCPDGFFCEQGAVCCQIPIQATFRPPPFTLQPPDYEVPAIVPPEEIVTERQFEEPTTTPVANETILVIRVKNNENGSTIIAGGNESLNILDRLNRTGSLGPNLIGPNGQVGPNNLGPDIIRQIPSGSTISNNNNNNNNNQGGSQLNGNINGGQFGGRQNNDNNNNNNNNGRPYPTDGPGFNNNGRINNNGNLNERSNNIGGNGQFPGSNNNINRDGNNRINIGGGGGSFPGPNDNNGGGQFPGTVTRGNGPNSFDNNNNNNINNNGGRGSNSLSSIGSQGLSRLRGNNNNNNNNNGQQSRGINNNNNRLSGQIINGQIVREPFDGGRLPPPATNNVRGGNDGANNDLRNLIDAINGIPRGITVDGGQNAGPTSNGLANGIGGFPGNSIKLKEQVQGILGNALTKLRFELKENQSKQKKQTIETKEKPTATATILSSSAGATVAVTDAKTKLSITTIRPLPSSSSTSSSVQPAKLKLSKEQKTISKIGIPGRISTFVGFNGGAPNSGRVLSSSAQSSTSSSSSSTSVLPTSSKQPSSSPPSVSTAAQSSSSLSEKTTPKPTDASSSDGDSARKIIVKPGACPSVEEVRPTENDGNLRLVCQHDQQCPGSFKCCQDPTVNALSDFGICRTPIAVPLGFD